MSYGHLAREGNLQRSSCESFLKIISTYMRWMSIYPFLTHCLLFLSMAEQGLSHPTQRRGATRPPDLGSLPPLPGLLPLTKHASHSQGLILQQFCVYNISFHPNMLNCVLGETPHICSLRVVCSCREMIFRNWFHKLEVGLVVCGR